MVATALPTPAPSLASFEWTGADGLRLAASAAGPLGEPPAVLFAHGFGQTRQAWARSMLALARQGLASAAWDLRGHGQSGRNPAGQPYAVPQFIDDVLALRATLPRPPVLVGASMGGLVGLAAEARGAGFRALVLVDVTPRWESAGMQRILAFMGAHPEGFEDHEHAARAIAAYLPHRRGRKSPTDLDHLLVRGTDGRLRWHWDPRLLEDLADSAKHQDALSEAARGIDIPVLLISGGRSDLVSEDTIAHFRSLVPHAEHRRLPDATHMVAGDDNDAFTRLVLDFLHARGDANPSTGPLHGALP
ncbi:MAG: alpha/beta hydrolase [Xanthomonadaceae bacterium]|jgi:pimeloyl-ACP methyl ester carboxylesterase|nr:alpha/beta hydrolase [Xanthomonadaceae bacterium]